MRLSRFFLFSVVALLMVCLVSADSFPERMSAEDFKDNVAKANTGWFSFFLMQSAFSNTGWQLCESNCGAYVFTHRECSPCDAGLGESNCFISPKGMSSLGYSSVGDFCFGRSDDMYNKQCFCSSPGCSGGGVSGDKKCEGDLIYRCDGDSWDYIGGCDFGCRNGACYGECDSDRDCGVSGWTGSNYCSGGDVFQKYTSPTCSDFICWSPSEGRLKVDCGDGVCEGGVCVSGVVPTPSPPPSPPPDLGCFADADCGYGMYCGSDGVCKVAGEVCEYWEKDYFRGECDWLCKLGVIDPAKGGCSVDSGVYFVGGISVLIVIMIILILLLPRNKRNQKTNSRRRLRK